jgi:TonB family protein
VKGVVAYRATPNVPQSIKDTIQGHVKVRIGLQVDSSGSVADATIDSPGPSRYFANRALEAARGWKFTPARMDGRAVASKWILQFHFGQDGTTITPTETSP